MSCILGLGFSLVDFNNYVCAIVCLCMDELIIGQVQNTCLILLPL